MKGCRTIGDSAARLICYDKLDVELAAATPTNPSFAVKPLSAPTAQETLQSHIVGRFEGWKANSTITLANGQVWQITDGSSAYFPRLSDPKVRIRTGMFGALYFEVEGENHMARVRRIK